MHKSAYYGHPAQLPPINHQGTVTGRIKTTHNPALHQLPKDNKPSLRYNEYHQGYLFRKGTELIAHLDAFFLYPSDFAQASQPGDLLLILTPGSRKKPQLFSRRGNTKYLWRQLKGRDALVQHLRALLLLQKP